MQRRDFLKTLVGGVAIATAQRVWPYRVYSFPSEICHYQTKIEIHYTYTKFGEIKDGIVLESTEHGLDHFKFDGPAQLWFAK